MSLYRYKLHLNNKGFNSTTAIDILNGQKTPVTFSNINMEMSLYGVSFNRKVYEPGHIRAEILVTSLITGTTIDVNLMSLMLLRRPVELYIEQYHEDGNKNAVVEKKYTVAQNYYIHDISPQFEKGKEVRVTEEENEETGEIIKKEKEVDINCIYVKLDIFSQDKLMTLNKYSQAHIGQKLFGDILERNKTSFSLKFETTSNGVTEITPVPILTSIRPLSHLVYVGDVINKDTSGNRSIASTSQELVHPYLVQYNESFYDFLRRTSNRCGEVFYFEDGMLCCGIAAGNPIAFTADEIGRVIFQRGASAPLNIRDYARDSVKQWNESNSSYKPDDDDILSDPVKPGDSGFPDDSFLEAKTGEHPFFYNSELAAEDQYMLLYKDKFARDSVTDLWCGGDGEHVMRTISTVLNSTSLMEMLTTFGLKELESAAKSAAKAGKATEKGNARLLKEALDASTGYAVMFSKVDDDKDHWITLDYTNDIKKGEMKQAAQMICIDMDKGFKDVGLGAKITIPSDPGTVYVVVRIEMSSGTDWQRSYEGFFNEGEEKLGGDYVQRFYAIPMDGDDFYPPMLPDEPFRRSGAQPAFVIDNSDPSGQGRVRIRYPWQPSAADAKKTFKKDSKEDDFKKSIEKLNEKYSVLDKFSKSISQDATGNVSATKCDDALESAFNTALEDYKSAWKVFLDKKEVYDAALAKYMVTEAATPWIRMSSPMATSGGGMFFKPEEGDEVMVDFENGNIERPFVIGTLYSKNVPAPKEGGRVIVSKNGHTIKMNDPTDGTALLAGMLPSVKFLQSYGCLDKNPIDMENGTVKALGGMELTDQFGFYNIKMSSHDRNISISSPFGDVYINALTGITIEAPNGDINITGKNVNISAYNKISINSGKNVKLAHDRWRLGWLSTGFDPSDAGKNVGKALGKVFSVGKFLDLSLLRTLLEIFVRPVDGTLDIKSGRFLLLQAGNSTAAGEFANYNVKKFDDWKLEENEPRILKEMIVYVKDSINNWITTFFLRHQAVVEAINQVSIAWDVNYGQNQHPILSAPANLDDLLDELFDYDPNNLKTEKDIENAFAQNLGHLHVANGTPSGVTSIVFNAVLELMKAAVELKRHFLNYDYDHLFPKLKDGSFVKGKLIIGRAKDSVSSLLSSHDVNSILVMRNPIVPAPAPQPGPVAAAVAPINIPALGITTLDNNAQPNDGFYSMRIVPVKDLVFQKTRNPNNFKCRLQPVFSIEWQKAITRRLMSLVIEKVRTGKPFKTFVIPAAEYKPVNGVGTAPVNMTHPYSDADWIKYVNEIKIIPPKSKESKLKSFFSGAGEELASVGWKVLPWESDTWSSDKDNSGQILFSEKKGDSFHFSDNGATVKRPNETRHDVVRKDVQSYLKSI